MHFELFIDVVVTVALFALVGRPRKLETTTVTNAGTDAERLESFLQDTDDSIAANDDHDSIDFYDADDADEYTLTEDDVATVELPTVERSPLQTDDLTRFVETGDQYAEPLESHKPKRGRRRTAASA